MAALKVWILAILVRVAVAGALPDLETGRRGDLLLITGDIALPVLKTAMEYVSVKAIMDLQNEAKDLQQEIESMATLTPINVYEADNFCPDNDVGVIEPIEVATRHGEPGMAKYVTPHFTTSGADPPFIVTATWAGSGALQCHYALSAKFKDKEDQLLSNQYYAYGDKASVKELVTPFLSCPNDEIHTGFYNADNRRQWVSHSAPLKTTTNSWACAEMCHNMHLASKCTGDDCNNETMRCDVWSFSYTRWQCVLSHLGSRTKAQQTAHVQKHIDKYHTFAITGAWSCLPKQLRGQLTVPVQASASKSNVTWLEVRKSCKYVPSIEAVTETVLKSCPGYAALARSLLRPSEEELAKLHGDLTGHTHDEGTQSRRIRRSALHGVMLPVSRVIATSLTVKKYIAAVVALTSKFGAATATGGVMALNPAILPLLPMAAVGVLVAGLIATVVAIAAGHLQAIGYEVIEGAGEGFYSTVRGGGNFTAPDLTLLHGAPAASHQRSRDILLRIDRHAAGVRQTATYVRDLLTAEQPWSSDTEALLLGKQYKYVRTYNRVAQTVETLYFYNSYEKTQTQRQALIVRLPGSHPRLLEGSPLAGRNETSPSWLCIDRLLAPKTAASKNQHPNACLGSRDMTLPRVSTWTFGLTNHVLRVIGQWIVEVTCPEATSTFGSLGVLILLHDESCAIKVADGIAFEAQQNRQSSRTGTFKVLHHSEGAFGALAFRNYGDGNIAVMFTYIPAMAALLGLGVLLIGVLLVWKQKSSGTLRSWPPRNMGNRRHNTPARRPSRKKRGVASISLDMC